MAIEQHGDDRAATLPGTAAESETAGPTLRDRLSTLLTKVTLADDAVVAAEPVSPHTPALPENGTKPSRGANTLLGLALVSGLAGGVLLAGTSPLMTQATGLVDRWRLRVPGLPHGDLTVSSFTYGLLFLVGVLAMVAGWLGLLAHTSRRSGAERSRVKLVLAASVLWALPFLVAPIQLSSDAYSYAAQGFLAVEGKDPSAVGVTALPHTPCFPGDTNCYWHGSDTIWRDSPAPYGPVWVGLAKASVMLTGEETYWTIYAFRFLAVAGIAMTAYGVYAIAKRRKVEPALALAIAAANPVVMIHLIGGAHNDALMMGLLAVALASWEKGRKLLAVVLVTLAVCVKLPAVIALAYMAWNWRGEGSEQPSVVDRLKAFPLLGAIAGGIIGVLCLAVGIGLGWLTALSSTGTVYSTFSLFTKLGFIAADGLNGLGFEVDAIAVTGVFRLVGLATAGAIMTAVLLQSHRLGTTKSVGIALLALMLCGPVIWPWYLPVCFALLAAAGIRRYRPTLIVLTVASSLIVWPLTVRSIDEMTRFQHYLGLLVVAIVAGSCVGAQYLARALERRREAGGAVPTIEAVLITASSAADEPAA